MICVAGTKVALGRKLNDIDPDTLVMLEIPEGQTRV